MKQSVKTRVGLFSFSQFYVFHTSLGSFISYGSLKKLPRKRTGCLKVGILPAPSIPFLLLLLADRVLYKLLIF